MLSWNVAATLTEGKQTEGALGVDVPRFARSSGLLIGVSSRVGVIQVIEAHKPLEGARAATGGSSRQAAARSIAPRFRAACCVRQASRGAALTGNRITPRGQDGDLLPH